ncbi:unnamed protein product [Effrenium voratum]|nr:unnamed protein product [Effrenium voratum]
MPPPPPAGLPKAPAAPSSLPKGPAAGYAATPPAAPTSLPSSGGRAVPPPGGLPAKPAAPSGLPKAEAKGVRTAPPPPRALPAVSARAGPSDSGFSAPPPPCGLPGAPGRAAPVSSAPAAPVRPAPKAPASIPARPAPAAPAAEGKSPVPSEPTEVPEEEQDESWRQFIEEESEESVHDSGDESDEGVAGQSDRHKNDMELLMKMQAKAAPTPKGQAASPVGQTATKEEAEEAEAEDDAEPDVNASVSQSPQKKGIMSRIFGGKQKCSIEIPVGTSMLGQDLSKRGDAWYEEHLSRLGKDGLRCTKVGTNGKPYERFVYLDSRNLTLEIRGGRSGTSGVMMDDLVDIRQGLNSPDFEQFLTRLSMDPKSGLEAKSLVLQTPHRTFSFIMSDKLQRDTFGYCILYLLKIKNRGVMAACTSPTVKAGQGPKSGYGKVIYPNRSSYEGQFRNYMRHGQGVLTLSDGTRYVAQWKDDERHGEGKEFCPDGTTFEGHYAAGMRHGYGVMQWPEGSKYSGMFERGRANGQGELLRTDGSVYRGQFCEDCMSGEGRMQWRDGVEYVGHFVANKREGYGTMTWTSGRWKKYAGQWKDGMQHELGTLMDHSDQDSSRGTSRWASWTTGSMSAKRRHWQPRGGRSLTPKWTHPIERVA